MGWWARFDRSEVAADFTRIATAGFDSIRLFLTWEHFQPARDQVDPQMLDRLVTVADLADTAGLGIMPTLFTGHMSGANWIPGWAVEGRATDTRFRVVTGDSVRSVGLRNWYSDEDITAAQALLAGQAAAALAGHEALWAWDLGNENSNCVVPPSRSSAQKWLERITSTIRAADPATLITIGLHMEDLEEDRRLGPREASEACDFLTMHGYPIYATWADSPTDHHLLPYLAEITSWLGNGSDVLFTEFGLPTSPRGGRPQQASNPLLVDEAIAATYTQRSLAALRRSGCAGAMIWCYSDYMPALWAKPPLDEAVHERSFGLWRADASPKPALRAIQSFAGTSRQHLAPNRTWIDIEPEQFYDDPKMELTRLYRRYRETGDTAP